MDEYTEDDCYAMEAAAEALDAEDSPCDYCYDDCEECPLMRAHAPTAVEADIMVTVGMNYFGE